MGSRVETIEELENAGGVIHIFLALIHALGWSLGELEDVRNDEGGPARLERAYSLLERWPDEVDRAELYQALENILYDNGAETDDDDDDEDEDDADDEQEGDNFKEAPAQPLVAGRSPQVEEEAAAAEAGVGLEPASQASQGSQDSVLNYENDSGDETEPPQYADSDLLDCGEETDAFSEEEGDEWAGEGEGGEDEVEETDKEESGEQSATDGETQATQGADGSDQEGAGPSGSRACSARLGSEACGGAVGHKRGADAAYCTPQAPKRPRHESSTSSTISTASTLEMETSMMAVEPPQDGLNNAGGALVVYHGAAAAMAAMPMVPIDDDGSMAEAAADETPLVALLQQQMSEMQQEQRQVMRNMNRMQQELVASSRVLQCLAYPEELVARANQAAVAIGTGFQRMGTGFLISPQGHMATCHHVLLDSNWDQHGSSLVDVGRGESIVWSHQAEVLAWAPTPKPPAQGMPDHRSGKPHPWLDLAILKLHPAPSPPLPHLFVSPHKLLPGTRVAIIGYGSQHPRSITEQGTTFGVVSRLRYDAKIGCKVIDIQGDMLPGHSGGPVIDLRNGGLVGYCISSQVEAVQANVDLELPSGMLAKGKVSLKVPCGGLHTAIPISELGFLLGTSLTA